MSQFRRKRRNRLFSPDNRITITISLHVLVCVDAQISHSRSQRPRMWHINHFMHIYERKWAIFVRDLAGWSYSIRHSRKNLLCYKTRDKRKHGILKCIHRNSAVWKYICFVSFNIATLRLISYFTTVCHCPLVPSTIVIYISSTELLL